MNAHIDDGAAPRVEPWEVALVVLVGVLAMLLRMWRIGSLPPGLHVDEAFNILDARAVLAGARPIFLLDNAGREVLYTYLQAPLLRLLGESPGTARMASAIAGTLTVPVVWGFTRSLPLPRPRATAILAAAYFSFSYWHLHFSRFGIRAVLFPLVVTAAMWFWWAAAGAQPAVSGDRPSRRAAQIAGLGVLLGLAFYTHPVGRMLWLVPLTHAAYTLVRYRDWRPLKLLAPALMVAALVALPLAVFWADHPGSFTGHAAEVSTLDEGASGLASNALAVAGMFNVAGDPAPWRNLKERPQLYRLLAAIGIDRDDPAALALRGRPVFDPLTGLLFLGGLGLALAAMRRGADWAALVLIWLALLLAPSVLTDDAPNYSRAIGALPIVNLLPALALSRLAYAAVPRVGRRWATALVVAAIAVHAVGTSYDYFVVWAGHEDTPNAFDDDKVALAEYADALTANGFDMFVSRTMSEHPTVKVSTAQPGGLRGFDPAHGIVLPEDDRVPAGYVYLAAEDSAASDLEQRTGLVAEDANERGHALSVVWLLDRSFRPPAAMSYILGTPNGLPPHVFGGTLSLVGWSVPDEAAAPGASVPVTLVWQTDEPIEDDLTAAVQILDENGSVVAQGDGPPIGGSFPTSTWRPGDLVVSTHDVAIPTDAPTGDFSVWVGWYRVLPLPISPLSDATRLEPLPADDGASVVEIDRLRIGPTR
ncbi:MAG: ArnT family glycosyltransferase [Anaerolineae bacterium]